jgi:DNA-binding MarR family transcriptional regulator
MSQIVRGAPARTRSDVSDARDPESGGLGADLRRAWLGYHQRLNTELADEGFADRSLPDGRVLRLCAREADTTISGIGRRLGISRQGAAKIVASLVERGYVTATTSRTNGRAKVVAVTPRAADYLQSIRRARLEIDAALRAELGDKPFAALEHLLRAIATDDDASQSVFLGPSGQAAARQRPEG